MLRHRVEGRGLLPLTRYPDEHRVVRSNVTMIPDRDRRHRIGNHPVVRPEQSVAVWRHECYVQERAIGSGRKKSRRALRARDAVEKSRRALRGCEFIPRHDLRF